MQIAIQILCLFCSLINLVILIFLSVFIVRFRDSLLNKKEEKITSDPQIDALNAATNRSVLRDLSLSGFDEEKF